MILQSSALKITQTKKLPFTPGLLRDPTKLRFENHTNKKTLKQAWRFFLLCDLFVTQGGFEPPTLRAEI